MSHSLTLALVASLGAFTAPGAAYGAAPTPAPLPSGEPPPGRVSFRTYDSEMGLANLVIDYLGQDSEGYLWVGTEDGLYRYDGAHFERFGLENGLPSSVITSLTVTPDSVWVGTFDGLSRWDGERLIAVGPESGLPARQIVDAAIGGDGTLWVATDEAVYRAVDERFEPVRAWPGGRPTSLWAEGDGTVLAAAGSHVLHLSATELRGTWEPPQPLVDEEIVSIARDHAGALYAQSQRHLWVVPPDNGTAYDLAPRIGAPIEDSLLSVDRRGQLWVPTKTGLWHVREPVLGLGTAAALPSPNGPNGPNGFNDLGPLERFGPETGLPPGEISLTDPLTGLKNRRFVAATLPKDVAQVQRACSARARTDARRALDNTDLVFFMIDLDHFKAVNDRHGHTAGDAVLRAMRDILVSVCRQSDTAVRWGGEEFLIVARQTSRSEAPVLAERLRRAVRERTFTLPDGTAMTRTCSIGFAAYPLVRDRAELASWEEVVDLADLCMYAAKRAGRDGWVGITGVGALAEGAATSTLLPDSLRSRLEALSPINGLMIEASSEAGRSVLIRGEAEDVAARRA